MSRRSWHPRVPIDAGLVVDRCAGNGRIHRIDPDGVGTLRADLERFWRKAVAAYKAAVEQPTKEVS